MNELDAAIALVHIWQNQERQAWDDANEKRGHGSDDQRWLDAKSQMETASDLAKNLITAASVRAGGTPVFPADPIDPDAAG